MKNILFALFCMLAYLQTGHAANGQSYEVPCDHRLQKYLNKILQLPNAKQLIAQIQQQGPIRIRVVNHSISQQFGAYWDRQDRVIGIHLSSQVSEGDIIGSIIFELHNALSNNKIDHLDALANSRQIGREKYVEAMEHLEYQNSKKASALAQEGIEKGLFPANARLNTYSCFEEHYYYQKASGHSAAFAQAYDHLHRR
jgi:hypothetical protein